MKSFIAILVIGFCLFELIQARTLEKRNIGDIVDLMIYSGTLNQAANASVNVYCIDSPTSLPLPINTTTIKDYTYIQYTTPTASRSTNPVWNNFMPFSATLFSLNSYMAIELWNRTSRRAFQYVGGVIFTVGQLEQFPPQSNLVLLDLLNRNIGTVLIAWNK